jgi:hypothetical protein
MSYLLFLMFEYKRYRRDAVMRIYADDLLVEELVLSEDINLKVRNQIHNAPRPSMKHGPDNFSRVYFVPEKLFMFELDKGHLNKRISIEVINDNNNYTNGFMTSFSYIKFHALFLIPDCLLDFNYWLRINYGSVVKENAWTQYDHFTKRYPRDNFFDGEIKMSPVTDTSESGFFFHKKGGSFSAEFELFKKHGVIHLGRPSAGKSYPNEETPKILHWFQLLNNYA